MVGPATARRDQAVGALSQCRADQELEIAELVPAEGKGQEIFSLDPDLHAAAECSREPRERLER
jgi:hypothetical protein